MNTAIFGTIRNRAAAINAGEGVDLSDASLSEVAEAESKAQDANAQIAEVTTLANGAVSTLKSEATKQASQIVALKVPPTTPATAVTWTSTLAGGTAKADLQLAADVSEIPQQLPRIMSVLDSKKSALASLTSQIAAKKAAMSPADLAKLAALKPPSLSSLTNKVTENKAALDAKFASRNAL
jgi:hypothetical protein